jgi:hypothetical protein
MAIVKGILVHGIPENATYDLVKILESATETGTYTIVSTYNYSYGSRATEYSLLDTTKWYKIQFFVSTGGSGAISDPVFGGDYDKAKPFVAVSTTFDGSGYASTSELYEKSNLTPADVTYSDSAKALKIARSYIDLITGDTGLRKFSYQFSSDVARRKYNATLELTKQAEINFALALIYKDLADDQIMRTVRLQEHKFDSVSIGQTSISPNESQKNLQIAEFFDAQSQRYSVQAQNYLNALKPTSVNMMWGQDRVFSKFINPTDIFNFSVGGSSGTNTESLDQYTIVLTGNGVAMNTTYVTIPGVKPLDTRATLEDSVLTVNGVTYDIDSYITSDTTVIRSGTGGFSLDLQTEFGKIIWNNKLTNGGFNLDNTDVITLRYWA